MLKRLGLGLVAALLTLEVILQIAASQSRDAGDRADLTILCVGDSHTFGAPFPKIQSYPSQLQKALRARHGEGIEVVNLGVPGANSAMVANRLEVQIAHHRPDLVLVWAGVNSLWNPLETESWNEDAASTIREALFRSRLFRLGAIAWYSLTSPEHERAKLIEWSEERTVFQYGSETLVVSSHQPSGSMDEKRRGIESDFTRMANIAARYDVPIAFLTYPYQATTTRTNVVNNAIRSVGLIRGIEVVETQHSLQRALEHGFSMDQLVVRAAGPHPRDVLYTYIVENLMPVVNRIVWPEPAQ